jgi:uncharacterized secreted protein with C-terminal beta-propeller domain
LLLALVALPALIGLPVAAAPADAKPRAAKRLVQFDSCRALLGYTRGVPLPPVAFRPDIRVGGGEGRRDGEAPVPAAGEDSSTTNVQEAGVDEPDTVKTDGRTIFAIARGALHAIDARAETPKLLATVPLPESGEPTMLLQGKRVLVLGSGPRGTRFTEIDVSDPARPEVLRIEDVDGAVVDARLTGRTARVVVSSYPRAVYGSPAARSRPAGWLPKRKLTNVRSGRTATRRVACREVRRPSVFSGSDMLTIYTVDMTKGLPAVDVDAVFATGETVYASQSSLYVATQRWLGVAGSTSIHRFDTADPDRTFYAGSGTVPGTLLNQFSLSEDKGVLRAATTVGFGEEAESRVTTLTAAGGRLVQRGQVGGLGRGERIYAVRFIGDVGYVVTFRETDPLYTVDLSDPAQPRVRGELKIPGYSAYLHPVADDLLLGVGQEATDDGRVQGLQLSLFDVSDLARPVRVQQAQLGTRFSSSEVEWDHHAFLFWPATKLAVLPMESGRFRGALGFRIDRASGIAELGRISHAAAGASWGPSVRRAVVVGDRLFTLSDLGAKASGLADLGDRAWVAFPRTGQQPPCCEPKPVEPDGGSGGSPG